MNLVRKELAIMSFLLSILIGVIIPNSIIYASETNVENANSKVILLYEFGGGEEITLEENFVVNDVIYYIIPKSKSYKTNQVIALGYEGLDKKIVIPTTVKYKGMEYRVTKIGSDPQNITGDDWTKFTNSWGKTLQEIILSDTVNEICNETFVNMTNLKKISIPGIKRIGYTAFSGSGITNLHIPKGATKVFGLDYTNIKTLDFPEGVKHFSIVGCSKLTSIRIPASASFMVKGETFEGCNNLKMITLSKDLDEYKAQKGIIYTKDGKGIIAAPSAGGKYDVPSSISYIGGTAFYGNNELTEVTIPKNVKTIGYAAFSNCTKLKKVNIENGVQEIGIDAFQDCTSIDSVSIPDSVKKIEIGSFENSGIKDININRVDGREVSEGAFYNTKYDNLLIATVKGYNGAEKLLDKEKLEWVKTLEGFYLTVNSTDSEVIKVKKAHDWLINLVEYDYYALNQSELDEKWWNSDDPHTDASSYNGMFTTRQLICSGYASAMKVLCELLDIECYEFYGTEEMNHMWNLVKVNGEWYQLDATWDDEGVNGIGYTYFLISDEQMAINHHWDYDEELPQCNNTITNY